MAQALLQMTGINDFEIQLPEIEIAIELLAFTQAARDPPPPYSLSPAPSQVPRPPTPTLYQ